METEYTVQNLKHQVSPQESKQIDTLYAQLIANGYNHSQALAIIYSTAWEASYQHGRRIRMRRYAIKQQDSQPKAIVEGSNTDER